MRWLVTGGAGYLGAHTVAALRRAGRDVVVYDDLSAGRPDRLGADVPLVVGSVTDRPLLTKTLREYAAGGILHFASRKSAPESVADPLHYYRENVGGMTALLEAMVAAGVGRIVLSSSAAVYGVPPAPVVTEETPTLPINPYGQTKLVCEQLLRSVGIAHGVSWLALRYFNVVGAAEPALADHSGSNLVPRIFRALDADGPIFVTGGDFPTRDGTGVRDYVHAADIADAHVAAVEALEREPMDAIYNVGTGLGYSVLEMLDCVRRVTGREVPYKTRERRPGDPPEVVAAVEKIRTDLGWKARRDLDEMVSSAWEAWRRQRVT